MIPKMVGYHVRPHLTRTRFAIEGLKFGLCLAIPGFSVYIFRVPLAPGTRTPPLATAAIVIRMPGPASPAREREGEIS